MRGPRGGERPAPLPPEDPEGAPGSPPQGPRSVPWVPLGPWDPLRSLGPLGPWCLGFPGPLGPWGHPKIIYLVGALRAPGWRQTRSSNKSGVPCAVVGWRCSAKPSLNN